MIVSCFLLEENTDKASPQTHIMRFRDAEGRMSGPIVAFETTSGVRYSLTPDVEKPWFRAEREGNCQVYGHMFNQPDLPSDTLVRTMPITRVFTGDGEIIETLLVLTRDPQNQIKTMADVAHDILERGGPTPKDDLLQLTRNGPPQVKKNRLH